MRPTRLEHWEYNEWLLVVDNEWRAVCDLRSLRERFNPPPPDAGQNWLEDADGPGAECRREEREPWTSWNWFVAPNTVDVMAGREMNARNSTPARPMSGHDDRN